MSRQIRWADLRVGIVAVVALFLLVAGILTFGRLGRIPGETYHVYVRAEEARGLIVGSEVWLAGQKIGAVRHIAFLPPREGEGRVLLDVELMARHRQAVRRDSHVDIRPGGNLIGAPVVAFGIGTPGSAPMTGGDTIVAKPQVDVAGFSDQYDEATADLPRIIEDVKALASLVRSPDGTLGAMMHDKGSEVMSLGTRVRGITGSRGPGTLALALGGREDLRRRAATAMSRVDSIRTLVASGDGNLGRFRRDSSLIDAVADVRNELSIVQALLAEPRGTLGRAGRDSAIVAALAAAQGEMAALMADVKRRPIRYLPF